MNTKKKNLNIMIFYNKSKINIRWHFFISFLLLSNNNKKRFFFVFHSISYYTIKIKKESKIK